MVSENEIKNEILNIENSKWNIQDSENVPKTENLSMTGSVVRFEGTVLYADMKRSSSLVDELSNVVAGKIYQAYHRSVAKLIHSSGGQIAAYDGDRIMGIFVGRDKNTTAVNCGLNINYVVTKILRPMLEDSFRSIQNSGIKISHCVGIDTSQILAVKAGVRDANDIIWVGRAPNLAANLSEIRIDNFYTFISKSVFERVNVKAKFGGKNNQMIWTEFTHKYLKEEINIYGSGWYMDI